MATISGLGGGLDVSGIVSQLMYLERQPERDLQAKESSLNSKASAYRDIKSKLSSLSSTAQTLSDAETAAAKTAVSSDTTVLSATASSSAVAGKYEIVVGQLATTDTFASEPLLAQNATILTGTFDLKVGDDAVKTITIDSSNNTLTGLRDAINSSGAGVSASVVKDGSTYKLAIISKDSGTDNEIVFSNFSNGAQQTQLGLARTVTLQDAELTINGISVTSSSNTVTDALQGVTLALSKQGSTNITVSSDTGKITEALNAFIKAYNDVNSFFTAQFKYDSAKKSAGILAGDPTLRIIQSQLQTALSSSLSGLSTPLTNLKEVGVNLANDGSLSLDATKLAEAIKENPTAVANVFQTTARFTDARVSLVATADKTQAGTYAVSVTTAAETAAITGGTAVDPDNGLSASGSVTVTYKGVEYAASLTAGHKIADIVDAVNATLESAGVGVRASDSGGKLKIATQGYGAGETVSVRASASVAGDLGLATTDTSDTGVDVVGTINGKAGYGSGQTLMAAIGGDQEGLALSINVSPADVGAGLALGNATITVGFAGMITRRTSQATNTTSGSIDSALRSIDARNKDIENSIAALEERLAKKEQLLTNEFTRADNALKQMQTRLAALSSQLSGLG